MRKEVIAQMNNLSDEAFNTLKSVATLFINEVSEIALDGNIKLEKVQEEIIARGIFKQWFSALLDECAEEKENNKQN